MVILSLKKILFRKCVNNTGNLSGFKANSYLFGSSMTPGKHRIFWPSEEYKTTPTQVQLLGTSIGRELLGTSIGRELLGTSIGRTTSTGSSGPVRSTRPA